MRRSMRRMGIPGALLLGAVLTGSAAWGQGHEGMHMPAPASRPAATAPAGAKVALSQDTEEGKKQLIATVTLADKPVANATVQFLVRRTFGLMVLGQDQTLDDGTAAVAFPTDLPGDATGNLQLSATVTGPLTVAGAKVEAVMAGGKPNPVVVQEPPRALWAPQAPVELIIVIFALVAGAWGIYGFVVLQLMAIRKGAKS